MLDITNVTKSFGQKPILENVSLHIGDGQITGLHGDSGIGKSTLANIVCGLVKPDSGQVCIDGMPLWNNGVYDRKHALGIQMVFQQPYASFDPVQRIGKGMLELMRFHNPRLRKAEAETAINEAVNRMQLKPSVLSHLPHQVSGGEAQRLAVAKLLLLNPRLLILDESTSMLDVSSQAVLTQLIAEASAAYGISILWISHDFPLLEAVADEIYMMDDRKLKRSK